MAQQQILCRSCKSRYAEYMTISGKSGYCRGCYERKGISRSEGITKGLTPRQRDKKGMGES